MTVPEPRLSVLIGRVSTVEPERIVEVLRALRLQETEEDHEVIVVDRSQDGFSARIARDFPEVRILSCDRSLPLPAMHDLALAAARGEIVIVTEDHCVPTSSWLHNISDEFRRYPAATGISGAVENGTSDGVVDRATYLCEYARFTPPIEEGTSAPLCGVNVAFRREALLRVPVELRRERFWDCGVQPYLREAGALLVATNRIRIEHRKRIPLRLFVAQRLAYSRQFAGLRFPPRAWLRRGAAALGTALLPLLLTARLVGYSLRSPTVARQASNCAPLLLLFYLVWAMGEFVGYTRGPGTALADVE